MSKSQGPIAYLVSQYPAISHTFILREARYLRQRGLEIRTSSINACDRDTERLTADEREERDATFYVKQTPAVSAIAAVLATFVTRPLSTLRGLRYAFQLAGAGLRNRAYGLFYLAEAILIGRWMRRENASHLHVHFATPASTVGLIVRRIFGVDLSITVHGPDEFYNTERYRLEEKIRESSFLCTIGTFSRSQVMKLSDFSQWDKFEVSPLGVDTDVFVPAKRLDTESSDGCFEVICVGRLVPAKGQHILVQAIARLVEEGRRVRLRLVGSGPDDRSLRELVKKHGIDSSVVFEGAVNQDRIRELYAQADVFALASFAEGIPVVLMEAMAMEIPCVTTRITGIPELIRDGVDGLLVAPSDEVELASAIAGLMDDAELRERIGRTGRQRVKEKYHLQTNTERLAQIFSRRLGIELPALDGASREPASREPASRERTGSATVTEESHDEKETRSLAPAHAHA